MADAILEQIQAGIRRVLTDPALKGELAGWERTVLIKVDSEYYTIRVANSMITATREKARHPEVEVRLSLPTFKEITTRKLNFTTAYLRGLLAVKGNVKASDITRLQKLL